MRKTGQSTRNEDVRSAHNETASTHNKSVARATETVVRTASIPGIPGIPVAACSTASWTAAAVPVVHLHVAVVAVSHLLLWPLQQLLAVLQEADTPSPRAAWARGLH